LLAGDNRQLAPIAAHDWEQEDRPPMQHYQPFNSAYDGVLRIINDAGVARASAWQSALTYTFRLPPLIRELIARVYDLDAIELQGADGFAPPAIRAGGAQGLGERLERADRARACRALRAHLPEQQSRRG
jgi:hypothetical protein